MNYDSILQLLLAVIANLPAEEQDAGELITSLRSLFDGLATGKITPQNFTAQVNALLAAASADDAAAEQADQQ